MRSRDMLERGEVLHTLYCCNEMYSMRRTVPVVLVGHCLHTLLLARCCEMSSGLSGEAPTNLEPDVRSSAFHLAPPQTSLDTLYICIDAEMRRASYNPI